MDQILDHLRAALADRYAVTRELGQGGMATVYLAQDLKHERPVAIKVLQPELAAALGTDRFLREIRLTARLNHPHILSLLDSGEAQGLAYYVMPYVEGESLRDRLRREKQLPVEDALDIAREVADALDYAHGHDVIHRDIKPENILLEGRHAVVADFGIARAVNVAGGEKLTATGVAVGTPEYMSPEQGSGRGELDARSDVYALGCVLYEMLAGHPPFIGTSAQEVLARHVLDAVPSLGAARPGVPPAVAQVISRALAKAPADRFTTTAELAQALRLEGPAQAASDTARAPPPTPWPFRISGRTILRRSVWPVLFLLALGYAFRQRVGQRPAAVAPAVFSVPLPSGTELAVGSGLALAVSPDADRYVYVARSATGTQLYARPIDQIDAVPIPGTDGATNPFFSPDGQGIAFVADGRMKHVSLGGGRPVTVTQLDGSFQGGSWGPNDTIVFAQGAPRPGIFVVAASGGAPALVATPDAGESSYWWPSQLPGDAILFAVATGMVYDPRRIVAFRPKTGERQIVLEEGIHARYAASDHIVYGERFAGETGVTAVKAVAFDPARLRVVGSPVTVLDSVVQTGSSTVQFDLSRDGSLVYVAARRRPASSTVLWRDRQGRDEVIDYLPTSVYRNPMISPDGQRVGITSGGDSMHTRLVDLRRQAVSELASGGRATHLAVWAPTGDRIAFASDREDSKVNLYVKWLVGRSDVERLTVSPQHQDPASWSPDGKYLLYVEDSPNTGWDIWALDVTSTPAAPRVLISTRAAETMPSISRDGRWLAYASNEPGHPEVYVDRFPELGARQQVSRGGGDEPVWSPVGNELFYTVPDSATGFVSLWVVDVAPGPELRLGVPRLLSQGGSIAARVSGGRPRYDVSRDGQRFLIVRVGDPPPPSLEFVVVLNWFDELRRRVRPARE